MQSSLENVVQNFPRESGEYITPLEYHVLRREDRALLIDPVNHVWFATDDLGVASVEAYARAHCFSDAIKIVADRFGLSDDDINARTYVEQLFKNLYEIGFLHKEVYKRRDLPTEPAAQPSVMYLHLTASCNLKCSYCYNQEHRFDFIKDVKSQAVEKRPSSTSTTEKFIKVLEDASNLGVTHVRLTGGEATLYKDFLVVARRAKDLGLHVNLLTNGALITEANAASIVECVDAVSISVDSKDASSGHDAIRGSGSHAKAIRAILLLKEAGLKSLHLNGVITPTTLDGVEDLIDFAWDELKVEDISLAGSVINVRDTGGRWGAKEHVLTKEEFGVLENKQYEASKKRGMASTPYYRNNCGVGSGVVSVDPNGDVYPCQTLHEKEFLLGNAFSVNLKNVLKSSAKREEVRQSTVDKIEECNVCPVRYICNSGCRSEAYSREGNFLARNKDMCPTFFAIAEKSLWDSVGIS